MALSVLRTKAVNDGGGSATAAAAKKKKAANAANSIISTVANGLFNNTKPAATTNKTTATTKPATTTKTTTSTPSKTTTTTKTTAPAVTTPVVTQAAVSTPTLNLPGLYELPDAGSYGERPSYQQSAAVQAAYNTYLQYMNSKPGAFQSNYQGQIDSLLGEIMNRPAFSYDFNADPMYQMYRDNYMEQGRQAMMDTMANAAALTGGYGSSYASTAGQQAYQANLQQLNNVIPELWQMAYDVYLNEGDSMRANMNLLQALDNTDYSRYRDTVSDWQTDRAFAWNAYNTEYDRDYGMYRDTVGDWESDRAFSYGADMDRYNASVAERDFAYDRYLDELSQQNWSSEFAYQQAQDALAQQNYEREWEYQVAQDALNRAARSSGGGGSGSSSYSADKNSNTFFGSLFGGSSDSLSFGGASGGMIGNKSTDELEELALNMWAGAGSGRNPYQLLENNASLTAAQKEYVRNALDDLNDNDVNVGYYRG